MTLAMTLGMSIGVRKTLWMMLGELLGVAIVAIAAVMGVASLMLNYPQVFSLLKWVGGVYLIYVGINMWRSRGSMAIVADSQKSISRITLFSQGFGTAIANPKGWAFMVSLLPPFINPQESMPVQLMALIAIILVSEFVCMMLYASGGKTLKLFLSQGDNIKLMNRIAGSLMILVGGWLALG